ncbi:MAG: DNA (cytosine-5-)-methyltransferase [Paludibacteraceae bacterium]|nr:DNA (cytosine-5-)-methyltransferase [Paludibacteraceae bacterium]
MKKFKFIDLFCGIGGFHQAMKALGGTCVYACDIDADCRKTYYANYGLMPDSDITKVDANKLPDFDVLCAGFPCQAFSKAGKRLGFADETKGTLFFDVERIMKACQPQYALLENVRNLASHDGGNTWKTIHEHLVNIGYNVLEEPVIFSPHYLGIPQHRERVFIMCVRKDIGTIPMFNFNATKLPKCDILDIMQTDSEISNIEHYKLSKDKIELINLWDEFIQNIKCEKLPGFPIWSDRLCELDPTEDLSQYPSWKQNFIRKNNQLYLQNKKFIDDWLKKALKCPAFFGAKAKLEWQAGQSKKPSLWDNILQFRPSGIRVKPGTYFPALVAITQTSIVGCRQRELTPRECARLQGFPDTFQPDIIEIQAYKQFGNAVNVDVVKLFAKYMFGDKSVLKKYAKQSDGVGLAHAVDFLRLQEEYPDTIVVNEPINIVTSKTKLGTSEAPTGNVDISDVDITRNLLISLVKNDNVERFLDGSANIYYTGKKFPSTVHLNKLYYFMPYVKGKGIKDLYFIKVARVGTRKEGQPDNDPNELRLVFEIEFIKSLFDEYKKIKLPIWDTFNDTTLGKLIDCD